MSRADLHLVADPDPNVEAACAPGTADRFDLARMMADLDPPSLGDAFAAAYGDATQRAVDRADDHMTRNEDDDYGDVDGGYRQQHTADLRDALRGRR